MKDQEGQPEEEAAADDRRDRTIVDDLSRSAPARTQPVPCLTGFICCCFNPFRRGFARLPVALARPAMHLRAWQHSLVRLLVRQGCPN